MAARRHIVDLRAVRLLRQRRLLRLLIAALAAAVVVASGAAAVASTPSGDGPRGHRIHLVTVLTSVANNSAGLGGPGDVVAAVFTFSLPHGATGHIAGSSQLTSTSEQLSHVAFVFPNGQIDAQAAITLPLTTFTAAIIGGTGAYEGVSGEVVNRVIATNPLTIDRTLHLIFPDHDG